jgi:hypothetical protein
MFNDGELGNLLAASFRGSIGHTPPAKDAEFLVVCPDEASNPDAEQIIRVITRHYSKLEYQVMAEDHGQTIETHIFHSSQKMVEFHAVISPKWHLEKRGDVGIWVRSHINCAAA